MENKGSKRKGNGGAEKLREKRRKLLEESATSWHSIQNFFPGTSKLENKSNKNSNQPTGQKEEIVDTSNSAPNNEKFELANIPDVSHDACTSASAAEDIQQEHHLKNQEADTVETTTCNLTETSDNITAVADSAFFFKKPKNNHELEVFLKGIQCNMNRQSYVNIIGN
jgi:hypothetical protein